MCPTGPTDDEHFYLGPDVLVDPQSEPQLDTIIFLAVTNCVFTSHNQLKLRTRTRWPHSSNEVGALKHGGFLALWYYETENIVS